MKKIVLKLATDDEKTKRKALQAIAGIEGVKSIAVGTKDKNITVIGEADPLFLAKKLKKFGFTELLSVVPAVEEKEKKKKKVKEKKKKEEEEQNAELPTVIYMSPSSNSYGNPSSINSNSYGTYQGYPYNVGRDDYNSSSCTIC